MRLERGAALVRRDDGYGDGLFQPFDENSVSWSVAKRCRRNGRSPQTFA
ncbi:MAG: hypothetical protein ACLRSW_12800 [Christensenellaceae bacterium]